MRSLPSPRQAVGALRIRAQEEVQSRRLRASLRDWTQRMPEVPALPLDLVSSGGRPLTTVVMPCYNHASFLPDAVHSLLVQTLDRFDTVMVDDCSTDTTREILPGLADRLRDRGKVTVVAHETNVGQAATLNEAIGLAETPLVTVLNDDDYLAETALAHLVAAFSDPGRIALAGTASRWFSGSERPAASGVLEHVPARRILPAESRQVRRPNDLNMTHSGMTVAKAAWAAVGGYREDHSARVISFSDRDFQLRVATLYPVAIVETPLVWWRSDSSVDAGRNT